MLIKITDFKGLITNADVEDIPSDHLVVMKNMRNVFGKAVKTFEFGEVLDELAGVNNIYTFLNNYLSDPEDGYRYDAIVINSITKILTLYRWTGAAWETTSLYETFYHKYARNPIILNGGTVRIFPGNVGYAVGTTEAKPIWIDYIDMKHFDELYTPAAGFNGYPAIINTPALYPTITEINKGFTGFTSGNVYYYKFSYIYDGIQEGLLSAPTVWTVSDVNRIPKITFTININTFIRRITAIKVYRYESDALPSIDADFKHIHTIELNRVKADLFYGTTGCWAGVKTVYIPDLVDYDFDDVPAYTKFQILMDVDGTLRTNEINEKTGICTGILTLVTAEPDYIATYDNVDWELQGWDGSWHTVDSGATGAFGGLKTFLIDGTFSGDDIIGSLFCFNDSTYERITDYNIDNYEFKIITTNADTLSGLYADKSWAIILPRKGSYMFTFSTPTITVNFFDMVFTDGASHPYPAEKSIKANGKYSRIISGRLVHANIVLDPGGANEIHEDWIVWSELDQYDIMKVSNVRNMIEGAGGLTGIEDLYGNAVFAKENAIVLMNMKDYPDAPTSWYIMESPHNIGNIADWGMKSVLGALYVCYYDGIYRLSVNNLAPSDQTPTQQLRISESINDVYLALSKTQKQAIVAEYNAYRNEIIYTLGDDEYAFNVLTGGWRQIEPDINLSIMTTDEEANIMAYDSDTTKFHNSGTAKSVTFQIRSKTFPLSNERKEPIHWIYVTYMSVSDLTLNLYTENSGTAVATATLPASSVMITRKVGIRYRAKKFSVEVIDEVASTTVTEIGKIQIEV